MEDQTRFDKTLETLKMINSGFQWVEGEQVPLTENDKQRILLTNIAVSMALMVDKMDKLNYIANDIDNEVTNR